MVKQRKDLLELVRQQAEGADLDFLREAMGVLVQAIMEAEVVAQIGAEHGERSASRLTQRNGYRPRPWDTRVGTVELQVPNVREWSSTIWAKHPPPVLAGRCLKPDDAHATSARASAGNGRNFWCRPWIDVVLG